MYGIPSVTSEGTPVFTLLPEALRRLRTWLIPRQTREKPSHIPSPTTTAICLIGSKSSSRHRRRLRPRSLTILSSIRPNCLLLECSRLPPTRSVAKLPLFLSFWMAHRDLSWLSCQSRPSMSPLILLQPVRLCSAILSVIIKC